MKLQLPTRRTSGIDDRLATQGLAFDLPTLRVRIARGEQVAFHTLGVVVRVNVEQGTIWLTDDANDQVMAANKSYACGTHRHVVITALADAEIVVGVEHP